VHLFITFDGSDDGFDALRTLVGHFNPAEQWRVTALVVMWPQRQSPIWDKALAHEADVDDLHRAMAEVANAALQRVRGLFREGTPFNGIAADGDPEEQILARIAAEKPDLVVIGITGGLRSRAVASILRQTMARTKRVVIIAHGADRTPPDP
jgi:nucleotide-binding universal stress UspA family protein